MYGLETELKQKLLDIQSFEEIGLLEDRQHAILAAVNIAKAMQYDADIRPLGLEDGAIETVNQADIPEWAAPITAYIILPTGQVAYFLAKSETQWDGHNRDQKMERLANYIKGDYEEGAVG